MGLLLLLILGFVVLPGILFAAAWLAVKAFRAARKLVGWLCLIAGLLLACIPGYYILVLLLVGGIS